VITRGRNGHTGERIEERSLTVGILIFGGRIANVVTELCTSDKICIGIDLVWLKKAMRRQENRRRVIGKQTIPVG
jgi:hypothetical protein